MQIRSWTILSVVAASAVLLSGCSFLMSADAPPTKRVVNMDYVGQQSVKYLVNKYDATAANVETDASGDTDVEASQKTLYNISVEVCDLDANRDEANCKSTDVLRAVDLTGAATSDDEMTAANERRVTSLYWYDPQTLYVAYLNVGSSVREGSGSTPQVKECKVGSDNSMSCSSAGTVNDKLFIQTTETTKMGGGGDNGDSDN